MTAVRKRKVERLLADWFQRSGFKVEPASGIATSHRADVNLESLAELVAGEIENARAAAFEEGRAAGCAEAELEDLA